MGPTWVLSAPDGPHVGPMNLAICDAVAILDFREMSWYIAQNFLQNHWFKFNFKFEWWPNRLYIVNNMPGDGLVLLLHQQANWWPDSWLAIRIPDSKVHGANIGPSWGRQDPGGPHVGPMNFAIWDVFYSSVLGANRVLHTPVGAAIEWAVVRRFSDRLASRKWLIESETKF